MDSSGGSYAEHYAVIVQNPAFYDIKSMVLGNAGEFLAFKWLPQLGTTYMWYL